MQAAHRDAEVFLRPEVKMEPLVSGWHAWLHLISPIQHALNIAYSQLPLLDSFAREPEVHASASADPAMFGGPFVDLTPDRAPLIQRHRDQMSERHSRLISLAGDVRQLDRTLQEKATGYALDEFYSTLPASLRGLVEFLYDVNDHATLRFREELAYDEYFETSGQQICLSMIEEASRPFFLTTPRLERPDCVMLSIPFSDRRLDRLASMRTTPASLEDITRELGVSDSQRSLFASLFTTEPPRTASSPRPGRGEVRMRYFGHACVLVQSAKTSVLIDPMFCWESHHDDGRFTFNDLPEHLDYVIISHSHHDHFSPEMLIQLRHRVGRILVPANNSGSVTDPSMAIALRRLGFSDVVVLSELDQIRFEDGTITSLPFAGEHCDLDIHSRHGLHLSIEGRHFAFLVDSNGMDPALFDRIAQRLGRHLDALFIGMECHGGPLSWLYSPLLSRRINRRNDESRRLSSLDSARAWEVLQKLTASRVFVYAMGQEPWLRFIMGLEYTPESIQKKEVAALLERCERARINAECLYISRELTF